ncbi:MAG: hypothetical protein MZV64_24680 [Ignavibacteriales bacterium]|nr:hypothetical protein [Ignavibacteriales bacterium]
MNKNDYTQIITVYADEAVVATYHELEEKAGAFENQSRVRSNIYFKQISNAACDAWKSAT